MLTSYHDMSASLNLPEIFNLQYNFGRKKKLEVKQRGETNQLSAVAWEVQINLERGLM